MKDIPNYALYVMDFVHCTGYEARIVGGYVRNHILGKLDYTDIDMATNMPIDKLVTYVHNHNIKCIPTGIKHGTVTLVIENQPIEITTLRKDVKTDGRHAEIEYTDSWFEDSLRRDFTFNAMYMDSKGDIYDFHNGMNDLQHGIIRFIGSPEDRIKEDYLRILRYFRFLTYYTPNYYDEEVINTLKSNIEGLSCVSSERIYNELITIFKSDNLIYTIDKFIWLLKPILNVTKNCFTVNMQDSFTNLPFEHRFATLIAFNGKETVEYVIEQIKPPKRIKKIIKTIIELFDSDDFAKYLLLLEKDIRMLAIQDLKFLLNNEKKYSEIKKIINEIPYEFDITGTDVMTYDMRNISKILKTLKNTWASKYGRISKSELLNSINNQFL